MSEPLCTPCNNLGYTVVAHYQGISASAARDGKGKPPECYYHHFGMPLPASITGKQSPTKEADIVSKVKPEQEDPLPEHAKVAKCNCGCGQDLPFGFRWNYLRGHRKQLRAEVNHAMTKETKSKPVDNGTSATVTINADFLERWWARMTFAEKLQVFKEQWHL